MLNPTNHKEFTTAFPANWKLLVSANGPELSIEMANESAEAAAWSLQLRVDY
jgi:hypothetical protein